MVAACFLTACDTAPPAESEGIRHTIETRFEDQNSEITVHLPEGYETNTSAFEEQTGQPKMTTNQMMVVYLSPVSVLISTHFDFEMIGDSEETRFAFDGWMSVATSKKEERWVFAAGQVGPGPGSQ